MSFVIFSMKSGKKGAAASFVAGRITNGGHVGSSLADRYLISGRLTRIFVIVDDRKIRNGHPILFMQSLKLYLHRADIFLGQKYVSAYVTNKVNKVYINLMSPTFLILDLLRRYEAPTCINFHHFYFQIFFQ